VTFLKGEKMDSDLYTKIDVKIKTDRIVGGTPKSKSVIEAWQKAVGATKDQTQKMVDEMGDQVITDEEMQENIEKAWTGFRKDEKGLYIEGRQIKAMLKESGNVTGITRTFSGSKNFITNGVFIYPKRSTWERMNQTDMKKLYATLRTPLVNVALLKDMITLTRQNYHLRSLLLRESIKTCSPSES
jgi:hypothetical protein